MSAGASTATPSAAQCALLVLVLVLLTTSGTAHKLFHNKAAAPVVGSNTGRSKRTPSKMNDWRELNRHMDYILSPPASLPMAGRDAWDHSAREHLARGSGRLARRPDGPVDQQLPGEPSCPQLRLFWREMTRQMGAGTSGPRGQLTRLPPLASLRPGDEIEFQGDDGSENYGAWNRYGWDVVPQSMELGVPLGVPIPVEIDVVEPADVPRALAAARADRLDNRLTRFISDGGGASGGGGGFGGPSDDGKFRQMSLSTNSIGFGHVGDDGSVAASNSIRHAFRQPPRPPSTSTAAAPTPLPAAAGDNCVDIARRTCSSAADCSCQGLFTCWRGACKPRKMVDLLRARGAAPGRPSGA